MGTVLRMRVEEPGRERLRVSTYSRVPTDIEKQFYADLIRRMATRRADLGMTQADLDHAMNIAPGLVGKWEMMDRLPSPFMFTCWALELGLVLVPIAI